MRSLVTLDHGAQFARHVTDADGMWIAVRHDDAFQHVPFGEDSKQPTFFVDHTHRANISRSHKLRCLLHRRRRSRRVRLAVAYHVTDQHRLCLLNWLWGALIIDASW